MRLPWVGLSSDANKPFSGIRSSNRGKKFDLMFLYNLSLRDPSFVSICISGSFSGEKRHEFLIVRGNSVIEILRPNPETGQLETLIRQDAFCKIRSVIPYRLTGSLKDYFIVGADTGRIVIMEYVKTESRNEFERIHQETFGKSGTRRIVPGQHLAADPKGRAVMISALEKGRLVYILNSDAAGKLAISSPLEASRAKSIVCCTVGVDVGYENPLFASLELDYAACEEDQPVEQPAKLLVYHELDLGLNQVVRKSSWPVEMSSNMLVSLPAHPDGPGGILVCQNNCINWFPTASEQDGVSIGIPRATSASFCESRDILLVSCVMHKSKSTFFLLVLSEDGDVFKITFNAERKQISISYFDTLEGAQSLSLTKNGFLFVSYFSGKNSLFQVQKLGINERYTFHSMDVISSNNLTFERRLELENLGLVDNFGSIFPISDFKLFSTENESYPALYTCTGSQPMPSLSVLQHGIPSTLVASSSIPSDSNGIWCLKAEANDAFHSFLVLSFSHRTMILQIGESILEFTGPHNFITNTATLQLYTMFNNNYLQVTCQTIRLIKSVSSFVDWKIPHSSKPITHATCNGRQLMVVLGGVELIYLEVDQLGGLTETVERKIVPSPICCLCIGSLPSTSAFCPYLAVGCEDQTCRIVSLHKGDSWLEMLSIQIFTSAPHSLQLTRTAMSDNSPLYLHVSLESGEYCSIAVSPVDGTLDKVKTRKISDFPFSLSTVSLNNDKCGVFVQGEKPHLVFSGTSSLLSVSPVLLPFAVNSVADFSSEQCPNGFVATSENSLNIFSLDVGTSSYSVTKSVPLMFTPKKMISSTSSYDSFAVIESDHCTEYVGTIVNDSSDQKKACHEDEMQISSGEEEEIVDSLATFEFVRRCPAGNWSSRISVFDPFTLNLRQDIRLGNAFVPISGTFVEFSSSLGYRYLIVGAVQNFIPNPKSFSKCALFTFRQSLETQQYEILHITDVEQIPLALCPFQGMLLVGVGNVLRMFDLGKQKLLRKCENRQCKGQIGAIYSKGLRAVVSDLQSGPLFFHYKVHDNQFVLLADDPLPRFLTSVVSVDWDTVAAADKFGNFVVNRIPDSLAQIVKADPSCSRITEKPWLQGAPNKCNAIVDFHVGELITHMEKGKVASHGRDCLIYSGILGSVGIFVPFQRKSEFDFFQLLESAMRQELGNLFGRDHFAYRSCYTPVQNTVDGSLCEMFLRIPQERKEALAASLGKSAQEISALLADLRESAAF